MIESGMIMVKVICLFLAAIVMLAECDGWGWLLVVALLV